jgi:type I restriction enzyme S subunit
VRTIELSTLSKLVMGQAPPSKNCNTDGVGVPFIKAGQFGLFEPIINEWTTNPLKLAQSNDVLICVVGATSGKINFGAECAIGRSVAAIRPDPLKLDQKFLYYFLSTWTGRLRSKSQGSAQGVITRRMLESLQIPYLSLEEQRRIAAILGKADEIRRKRKEAIRLTDELLRSVFLDMFGDPVINPKGWDVRKLGDILYDIESGWSPKCEMREASKQEWGVLKLGAVTYGHFNQNENKAMLAADKPKKELEVKPGDLLLARKNTYELVGASAFVWKTRSKINVARFDF